MKFSVSSSILLKELTVLYPIIPTNPVVPILENVLFDINQDTLTITASDLTTFIVGHVPIKNQDKLHLRMAVPARMLLDTLKSLPEQSLLIHLDSLTYGITINWTQGQYKFSGEAL